MEKNFRIERKCSIKVNNAYTAESLEQEMRVATAGNAPIEMISPQLYTERKDGVLAQYDIRTDRFEVAMNAMDAVSRSHTAKREQRISKLNEEKTANE